jgi:non-canonical poly(A) RNA polymerase PAPD5/7
VATFAYKDHNRLSIIDPNNSSNDIAGGSSNAGTVLSHFAQAHQDITRHMAQLAQDPTKHDQSILGVIMGGNYSSFQEQRDYLELLSRPGHRQLRSQPATQPATQKTSTSQGRNGGSRKRR